LSKLIDKAKRFRPKPGPRLNSVRQIHAELRRLLVRGTFGPGSEGSQMRLCKTLAAGRTPLREALRMLQQEGLIVAEANKRPRVIMRDQKGTIEDLIAESDKVACRFSWRDSPRRHDGRRSDW
jgi:DNA-binding GntR family transcriptional regulator